MGISAARADIYTWTDASGRVNISNLAPPEGARVTSVLHETPKPPRPQGEAPPQPDVRMLAESVMQLEAELDSARRQPPPAVVYAAAPPQPQYLPQAIPQYSYPEPAPAPSYGYGCDPSMFGCGFAWSPWGYPASIVVVRSPGVRRPAFHGMHRPVYPQPIARGTPHYGGPNYGGPHSGSPHSGGSPGRPSPGMSRR